MFCCAQQGQGATEVPTVVGHRIRELGPQSSTEMLWGCSKLCPGCNCPLGAINQEGMAGTQGTLDWPPILMLAHASPRYGPYMWALELDTILQGLTNAISRGNTTSCSISPWMTLASLVTALHWQLMVSWLAPGPLHPFQSPARGAVYLAGLSMSWAVPVKSLAAQLGLLTLDPLSKRKL